MPILLFSFIALLSAFLLFWVQPLISKMLLPLLGGSPSVWNTCMVFFQGILLLGYGYTHYTTKYLGTRYQSILHIVLFPLAIFFLPVSLHYLGLPDPNINPIPWLLKCLLFTVGLPFFILSTTAPLIQKWFAATKHPAACDPYFLYSASNLGSMLSLLAFPFLLEPYLRVIEQNHYWMWGYIILDFAILLSVIYVWRNFSASTLVNQYVTSKQQPTYLTRLHWILLSFAPSSLLLGLTTHITTDIASMPLLWIIPLGLYLLTFIIVFAQRQIITLNFIVKIQPIILIPLIFILPTEPFRLPTLELLMIHITAFFITALMCHAELARRRPAAEYLTEYYLYMSLGGFLGGIFNAIVAPVIFTSTFEYPIAIVIACLLRPRFDHKPSNFYAKFFDMLIPAVIGVVLFGYYFYCLHIAEQRTPVTPWASLVAIILATFFARRSWRYGLSIAAILLVKIFFNDVLDPNMLYQARNFFGTLTVEKAVNGKAHILFSGTTMHGAEFFADNPQKQKGLTYYRPLIKVFNSLQQTNTAINIAGAGMGVGTIACLVRPNDNVTFYEIDPNDIKIAFNTEYFTYLTTCPPRGGIIVGDARLNLQQAQNHYFDLIVLDTFSSDAIPVHIVTIEAVQMYLQKLKLNGMLAFHITNHYLDLRPVLAALAHHANLQAFIHEEQFADVENFNYRSWWVVMVRNQSVMQNLLEKNDGWKALPYQKNYPLWTDDYSNIWQIIK